MVLIPDFIKKKKIIAAYNKGRCVTPPLKKPPHKILLNGSIIN